jgi:hypothetical protein
MKMRPVITVRRKAGLLQAVYTGREAILRDDISIECCVGTVKIDCLITSLGTLTDQNVRSKGLN